MMEVKKPFQQKGKFKKNWKKNPKRLENKKKRPGKQALAKQNIDQLKSSYESIDTKSIKKFTDLPLSDGTRRGLADSGYKDPTEIQRESIGLALRGLDILGAAKTGSGKTLAFVVPILERLYCQQWNRMDGVGALVITPTRELAYQIFETLRKVGRYHEFSAGLVIGGKDLKFEWKRLHGCNILICTPGRLLQHLDENPAFHMNNLQILVLDEADRCLDLGFKDAMNSIISSLPPDRQTLLFSATQTRSIDDLARLSLDKPVYVSVHENAANSTPEQLVQSYVVTELHNKVNILWSFLKNHKKKKTLVFLQSCKQVKYIYEIFCRMRPGLSVLALYGSLHQLKRMAIYDQFCTKESAVLFATDIAARGLDFPAVDWVIQLDCPEDGVTYVHRVGRTARYNKVGESLLVLLPQEEEGMLKQMAAHSIPADKIEINPVKLFQIEKKMAAHLASDKNLKESAQRAFQAYVKSVYLMKNKAIFNAFKLDLPRFAESLGLATTPRVRFLDKQKKIKEEQGKKSLDILAKPGKESSDEEELTGLAKDRVDKISLAVSDSDEEDDEIFTLKRKHHELEDSQDGENEDGDQDLLLGEPGRKKKAALTKVQQAKKVLKKKIQANTKITFDDETGDVVPDAAKTKVSEAGRQYEDEDDDEDRFGGGIDIEKAKQVLKEEDKFDKINQRRRIKEMKKEKKLKEKEKNKEVDEADEESGSDSEESVDLSWLPDPDKVYNKENVDGEKGSESSDEDGSDDEDEADDTMTEVKEGSKSVMVIKKRIPQQKKESEDEKEILDTGLSLEDDEDLALQLLRR